MGNEPLSIQYPYSSLGSLGDWFWECPLWHSLLPRQACTRTEELASLRFATDAATVQQCGMEVRPASGHRLTITLFWIW